MEGKHHLIADAFSRYPVENAEEDESEEDSTMLAILQCDNSDVDKFGKICKEDTHYQELLKAVKEMDRKKLSTLSPGHAARQYISCWDDLSTIQQGPEELVVYKTDRLVVPPKMRRQMLSRLHTEGHCGTTKMRRLAQEMVFWPGIGKDILDFVTKCGPCQEQLPSLPKEPLISQSADRPMEQISCDLFQWEGKDYLAVVDRYSGYIWAKILRKTGTENVTKVLEDIFNDFGFPRKIQTDNGPQFRGPFQKFCENIGTVHETSSPFNPSSNGLAESAVKTAKKLLSKSKASEMAFSSALHAWRNTPRSDGLAPTDLLFGFRQRMPNSPPRLTCTTFVNREEEGKARQQRKEDNFAKRGGTPLVQFKEGDSALLQNKRNRWTDPVTVGPARQSGRSYTVIKEEGDEAVRNRRFLRPT